MSIKTLYSELYLGSYCSTKDEFLPKYFLATLVFQFLVTRA